MRAADRRSTASVLLVLAAAGLALPAAAQEPGGTAEREPAQRAESAAREVAERPGPIAALAHVLARDVRRMVAPAARRTLLDSAVLALAAYPFDAVTTLGASSSHVLKAGFSGWGKALGREWVQGGGALATYVGGRLLDKPRLTEAGADLIEAQIVTVAVTQGLKYAVGRQRPDAEARSFPSGHASAAFATASVLHEHFGRRAAMAAYSVAVYTSASRLQANSHYASDVIVGAALGMAAGRAAAFDVGAAHVRVTPAATAGGAAVQVGVATRARAVR